MSVEHMGLVFAAEGLSSAEKAVLLAMCNYTDAHGKCYPGMTRIEVMIALSKSTIKRTRKGLEEKELLVHQRRTTRVGDATSNVYRVNLTLLATMAQPGRTYDDDDLLDQLGFGDKKNSYPQAKPASDQPRVHGDPTPSDPGGVTMTPPGSMVTRGGSTMTPPWGHGGPLSVIRSVSDPVDDPIRNADAPRGRTDHPSQNEDEHGRYARYASYIVNKLDFSKVDARPRQITHITTIVRKAITAGTDPDFLLAYLTGKVAEANTVKYILTALTPDYLNSPDSEPPPTLQLVTPPACGKCDARPDDPISARTIASNGRTAKCPHCHPYRTRQNNGIEQPPKRTAP